jgi:GT2 family glycosyltransferase
MRVIFCVPGRTFSGYFLKSWTKLISELQSMKIKWELVTFYHPDIYQVRQDCLRLALIYRYDYIMWIDSDMVFEPEDFTQLLSYYDKDIVSGLYFRKKVADIYDIPDEYTGIGMDGKILKRSDYEGVTGLKQIKANGMGWMLVKKGVFESIKNPFDSSLRVSEDYAFQFKALEHGYKSYVDTSVVLGHEKSFIMR